MNSLNISQHQANYAAALGCSKTDFAALYAAHHVAA
jgi:hypothetical protein